MSEEELKRIPAEAPMWRVLLYEVRQYGIAAVVAVILGVALYQGVSTIYQDDRTSIRAKDARIEQLTDGLKSAYVANATALENLTEEIKRRNNN
jgi:hypothetical protein